MKKQEFVIVALITVITVIFLDIFVAVPAINYHYDDHYEKLIWFGNIQTNNPKISKYTLQQMFEKEYKGWHWGKYHWVEIRYKENWWEENEYNFTVYDVCSGYFYDDLSIVVTTFYNMAIMILLIMLGVWIK